MEAASHKGLGVEDAVDPLSSPFAKPFGEEEAQQRGSEDDKMHFRWRQSEAVASDDGSDHAEGSYSSEDWQAALREEMSWGSVHHRSDASSSDTSITHRTGSVVLVSDSRSCLLTFEYEFEELLVDEFDPKENAARNSEEGEGSEVHGVMNGATDRLEVMSTTIPPSVTITNDGISEESDEEEHQEGGAKPEMQLAPVALIPPNNIYLQDDRAKPPSRDVLQMAREHELKSRIWMSRAERAAEMAKAAEHHRMFGGDCYSNWTRKRKKFAWKHRWLVVKENCVAYYRSPLSDTPLGVILFDNEFDVEERDHKGVRQLIISNKMRRSIFLSIKWRAPTRWRSHIMHALDASPYSRPSRYGSTMPVRRPCYVRMLVDGMHGFECMALAMAAARAEIMVCSWWLVLDLPLIRGDTQINPPSSMRNLLLHAAGRGVKVYIMVYQEVPVLVNDSLRVEQMFAGVPNILVIRHPPPEDRVFFWSHHEKVLIVDREVAFVGGLDFTYNRWDTSSHCIWSPDSALFYPGIDYRNPRIQDYLASHVANPLQDIIDREAYPRLPWHDVHCAAYGPIVDDFVYHFIARWDFTRRDNRAKYGSYPVLLPKTEGERLRHDNDLIEQIEQCGDNILKLPPRLPVSCQLVRSLAAWSGGLKQPEHSIEEAYVSIIQNAKHYVYIENQYFISATPNLTSPNEPTIDDAPNGTYPSSDTPVIARNRIAWALYLRISEAIRTNHTFRAIIICPMMPDMHGDVATNVALRAVVHNELHTIRWLFNSLQAAHPTANIEHYLSVHCLHQFQVLPSGAVLHGEIYVHAKTMIVDDRTIVVGSANINDRSMRGTRDSETVLVIEDHSYVKSMMNGKPYKAGANAHSLRLRLWLEHLGHIGGKCAGGRHDEAETPWNHTNLSMEVVHALYDPVHDNTYLHIWKHISSINTIAYTRAFPSFPSNEIRSLTELHERLRDAEEGATKDDSKRKEIAEKLRVVQGHLVDYPIDFLVDSDLSPPLTAPESLLPSYVFV